MQMTSHYFSNASKMMNNASEVADWAGLRFKLAKCGYQAQPENVDKLNVETRMALQ